MEEGKSNNVEEGNAKVMVVEESPNKCILTIRFMKIYWKSLFLALWPIICLPIILNSHVLSLSNAEGAKFRCLYCVAIMGGYWVSECAPLAITGLMPVFLFPTLNVMESAQTTECFFKEVNMVFMGGLLLAICVENSNLHTRIALFTIMKVGCSPRRLHLGILLITMFLSMWLVNSATAAMMCPIIRAILEEMENQGIGSFYEPQTEEQRKAGEPKMPSKCTICFYLGVAYAASIGGVGTLVGTPTNLAFKGLLEATFKGHNMLEFLPWMGFNVPATLIMILLTWLWLQILYLGMFRPNSPEGKFAKQADEKKDGAYRVMQGRYKDLGSMTWHESWVAGLFAFVMLLWFFRSPKFMPGWGDLMSQGIEDEKKRSKYIKDSVPALFVLFLMIVIPSTSAFLNSWSKDPEKRPTKSVPGLVTWKQLQEKMPWGAIFLLGGGFAIAKAGEMSGMNTWIGIQLEPIKNLNKYLVMVIMTILASFMTEMTSNAAICNIITPVLFSISKVMHANPLLVGLPAALACSFAFMLPVGTPTNTIAAGYAGIRTKDMAIGGSVVKLICVSVTILLFVTYGRVFWDIDHLSPSWINGTETIVNSTMKSIGGAVLNATTTLPTIASATASSAAIVA